MAMSKTKGDPGNIQYDCYAFEISEIGRPMCRALSGLVCRERNCSCYDTKEHHAATQRRAEARLDRIRRGLPV